jgi:hypothetical protein
MKKLMQNQYVTWHDRTGLYMGRVIVEGTRTLAIKVGERIHFMDKRNVIPYLQ